MVGPMAGIGIAGALVAAVIAWAVARRYGWRVGLIVPLLALVSLIALLWQARLFSLSDGFTLAATALTVTGPTLAGALLGLMLAARKR
ncbi:MAG: hypothetical protein B7Z10_01765 [Rhodobacterales bacterium 32-66-7]|nr:MAG: hypothetical protein B7Z31_03115 [Rhodobacterales bacterium 12-65-15]OYX26928.1 MAG: hypothetical protein B7Z10_01765 [Rhodobacterales bacterium 32-66-7]